MAGNPKTPVRADHRYIKQLMGTIMGGKVEHVPQEFDLVAAIFNRAGGSWERLFHGSPDDIDLLRQVMLVMFKKGLLTKKFKWSGSDKTEGKPGEDCG